MKATKVRKRVTGEAPLENISGAKKPTRRSGGRRNSKTGTNNNTLTRDDPAVLPFTTTKVVDQQLLREDALPQEIKQAQEVKPNAGYLLEKIKLQLFPIDEATRSGLEKDGHNPYLELTLRARKKISSVLKHLNNKWGSSSVAVGEVMLFPYNIQLENLSKYKRWSINDNLSSAGDVHADVESPALFRLRYGWFSTLDSRIFKAPYKSTLLGAPSESHGLQKISGRIPLMDRNRKLECTSEVFKPSITSKIADAGISEKEPVNEAIGHVDEDKSKSLNHPEMPWDDSLTNLSIGGLLSEVSLLGKINNCDSKSKGMNSTSQPIQLLSSDISIGGLFSEASRQGNVTDNEAKFSGTKPSTLFKVDNNGNLASFHWDDSFTALSIGGLLSEASQQAKIDHPNKSELQPTPLISDSFDSFIFGGGRSQTQKSKPSTQVSHASILDREETCHAFAFRKSLPGKSSAPLDGNVTLTNCNNVSEESKTGQLADPRMNDDESSLGLGGIKWTESLGPFDICFPSTEQNRSDSILSISKFVR